MELSFLAKTLDVVGKLMIAYTAIQVHYRIWKEHKIDRKVFVEMKIERKVGIAGILFIVVAYILEAYIHYFA